MGADKYNNNKKCTILRSGSMNTEIAAGGAMFSCHWENKKQNLPDLFASNGARCLGLFCSDIVVRATDAE